jgi:hypothetical protein
MKKTNQEIINAITDASEFSFIDSNNEGSVRFCLSISENDRETVGNGLREAGLTPKHLTQLTEEGIVVEHHIDDYCLNIRIKDSFLSEEQMEYAKEEREKDLALEAHHKEEEEEKKHADKCVEMHSKFVGALKEIILYGKCKDKRFSFTTSEESFNEFKKLIAEAEQK